VRKIGYISYTKLWQRFAPTHLFVTELYDERIIDYLWQACKGIHKHYCGVAVADVAKTGAAALVISKLTNKSFPLIFVALIALRVRN
jgi:hypothetical protein